MSAASASGFAAARSTAIWFSVRILICDPREQPVHPRDPPIQQPVGVVVLQAVGEVLGLGDALNRGLPIHPSPLATNGDVVAAVADQDSMSAAARFVSAVEDTQVAARAGWAARRPVARSPAAIAV
jgi:hypothetical protein